MVLKFSTKDEPLDVDREDFFEVDGEMYTIPKVVPSAEAIVYLNDVRDRGSEYAVASAMTRLIGEKGMHALGRCKAMTKDDLKVIRDVVEKKLGAAVDAEGN